MWLIDQVIGPLNVKRFHFFVVDLFSAKPTSNFGIRFPPPTKTYFLLTKYSHSRKCYDHWNYLSSLYPHPSLPPSSSGREQVLFVVSSGHLKELTLSLHLYFPLSSSRPLHHHPSPGLLCTFLNFLSLKLPTPTESTLPYGIHSSVPSESCLLLKPHLMPSPILTATQLH